MASANPSVTDPKRIRDLLAERDVRNRYVPRKWAETLMASFCRFIVLVKHRRAGKTIGTLNYHIRAARNDEWEATRLRMLEPAYTEDDITELLRGRRYIHVLPTRVQAKEVAWNPLKYYTNGIPGARSYESDLMVTFPKTKRNKEGSFVKLFGADDPDSMRGFPASGCSLDEYSQMDPTTYSEVLSKSLADHLGYAIFEGTLKGKNHLYRTWDEGRKDPEWLAMWTDIHDSLKRESGATITALKRAMLDDQALIAKGLMTQEEYDQEWFLSTVAAIKGAYYSKQLAAAEKSRRVCPVPWDPALPVHDVWDLGSGAQLIVGCFQKHGAQMRLIETLVGPDSEGMEQMITRLKAKTTNEGWIFGKHFAPHDVRAREITSGERRIDTAAKLRWPFEVVAVPRTVKNVVDDGIAMARAMFARLWIDSERNQHFLDAIGHYRQGWDKKNGVLTGQPVHDWASHPADMLRYAALAEAEMTNDATSDVSRSESAPLPPIVFTGIVSPY